MKKMIPSHKRNELETTPMTMRRAIAPAPMSVDGPSSLIGIRCMLLRFSRAALGLANGGLKSGEGPFPNTHRYIVNFIRGVRRASGETSQYLESTHAGSV